MSVAPTLDVETSLLLAGHGLVAGVDEVGRGALAGPVSVGVVVVDAASGPAPSRLRDSKLLSPAVREALAPSLREWSRAWAVGHAEADEVDGVGVVAALRLAGWRALEALPEMPSAVLVDGSHDWLTRRECSPEDARTHPVVTTRVKADLTCAAVAAASVLAKTTRDAIMMERSVVEPAYGWASNKGYAAPEHVAALRRLGPCAQHRRSWRLPLGPASLAWAGVHDGPR